MCVNGNPTRSVKCFLARTTAMIENYISHDLIFAQKNVRCFDFFNTHISTHTCMWPSTSWWSRDDICMSKMNVDLKELRALQNLYPIQLLSAGNPIMPAHIPSQRVLFHVENLNSADCTSANFHTNIFISLVSDSGLHLHNEILCLL